MALLLSELSSADKEVKDDSGADCKDVDTIPEAAAAGGGEKVHVLSERTFLKFVVYLSFPSQGW